MPSSPKYLLKIVALDCSMGENMKVLPEIRIGVAVKGAFAVRNANRNGVATYGYQVDDR